VPSILIVPLSLGLTSTVSSYFPGQLASAGLTKGNATMTGDNTRATSNHSEAIFNFILYTIAVYQPCLKQSV